MAQYSAVSTRLNFGSGTSTGSRLADIRALTGWTTSTVNDTKLTFMLNAALAEADEYTNNPFWQRDTDPDSADYGEYVEPHVELSIPLSIAQGVLLLLDLTLNGRVTMEQSIGVGQWNITRYGQPERVKVAIIEQAWSKYRLTPGV